MTDDQHAGSELSLQFFNLVLLAATAMTFCEMKQLLPASWCAGKI
jgi:hypothetical protein